MKLNIGKLAQLLGQIVVAVPTVIAAVKPVVDEFKKLPKRGT